MVIWNLNSAKVRVTININKLTSGDFRAVHFYGNGLRFTIKGKCLKEVVAMIMRYVFGGDGTVFMQSIKLCLPIQPLTVKALIPIELCLTS